MGLFEYSVINMANIDGDTSFPPNAFCLSEIFGEKENQLSERRDDYLGSKNSNCRDSEGSDLKGILSAWGRVSPKPSDYCFPFLKKNSESFLLDREKYSQDGVKAIKEFPSSLWIDIERSRRVQLNLFLKKHNDRPWKKKEERNLFPIISPSGILWRVTVCGRLWLRRGFSRKNLQSPGTLRFCIAPQRKFLECSRSDAALLETSEPYQHQSDFFCLIPP